MLWHGLGHIYGPNWMPCHGPTSALNQHNQGNGHCIYNFFFIILLFSYYIFKWNNISCSCLSSNGIHFHSDRIGFPLDGCFSNQTFHIFHNQIFHMLYIYFAFIILQNQNSYDEGDQLIRFNWMCACLSVMLCYVVFEWKRSSFVQTF